MLRVYYLFHASWSLSLAFGRAWWYARGQLARDLQLPKILAADNHEMRRRRHYFLGSTYLATVMGCLHKLNRSPDEIYLFANLSTLACYFDDLVDAVRTDERSFSWKDNPEVFGIALDRRGLALHLLHNIYRKLPEKGKATFQNYMHRVFNVETAGRQMLRKRWPLEQALADASPSVVQEEPVLDIEQLKNITAEKGGASVLLFRSLLNQDLSSAEEKALYQFGYLIQLSDDIFDFWHDRQAGIATLATLLIERGELEQLIELYEQQVSVTHRAFRQTSFPSKQVETSLYSLHYLVSITRICLQHYLDVAREFSVLPLHDRTIMVVDMETLNNILRLAGYLFRPVEQNS
ncbi:MAG: hypothetical protein ACKVT2_04280 [Saprospiraceae bacterium]